MRFQDNLRNLRVSHGYTQMRLAEGLKTSQSAITAWETGAREPDFATIKRIANFFDVPLSALLPSDEDVPEDLVHSIADSLHQNPKLCALFKKSRYLSEQDLDTVLSVVNAISRERENLE